MKIESRSDDLLSDYSGNGHVYEAMEEDENKGNKPKKLGMPEWQTYRNGNWAIAESGTLTHTITNERLARRGYYDISEAYKSMHLI